MSQATEKWVKKKRVLVAARRPFRQRRRRQLWRQLRQHICSNLFQKTIKLYNKLYICLKFYMLASWRTCCSNQPLKSSARLQISSIAPINSCRTKKPDWAWWYKNSTPSWYVGLGSTAKWQVRNSSCVKACVNRAEWKRQRDIQNYDNLQRMGGRVYHLTDVDVQTPRISSSFLHNLHEYQTAAAAAVATVNVLHFQPLHERNILFLTYYYTKPMNQK